MISLLLFVFCASSTYAQLIDNDTLAQVVRKVFYDKRVYDKIFTHHPEFMDKPSILLMNNIPFMRHYTEEVMGKLMDMDDQVGKKRYANIYLKSDQGDVVLTIPYYGSESVLFTAIHKFSYTSSEANLIFHTGSKNMIDSLADNYVKVTSSLIYRKGEWEIKKLKIEKTDCCKEYPYDALEIIDERHYYYFPPGYVRKKPDDDH